jgi:CheY-like chemotaxis protein
VNDVLDFSKIEAGAVELESEPIVLEALVENCMSIVGKLAEAKRLVLTFKLDPELPRIVIGDDQRLRQVLLNLLNNAIKFTPSGQVAVSLDRDRGNGQDLLRFTVRDTGIGIPKDKQSRLFQRFSQVDSSASRQFGGTGLGLAISKRLVDLMGGEIGVTSEPGSGSAFWFCIPVSEAPDEEAASPQSEAAAQSRPGRSFRILLAEDIEINQEIAKAVLEGAGHKVDIVCDGAQAVMAVQQKAYDLVLMDVQMPSMDGMTATRHIRALDPPRCEIPILAMTANVYAEQISAFLQTGMSGHIGKPFRRDELLAAVARAVPQAEPPPENAVEAQQPEILDAAVFDDLSAMVGRDRTLWMLDKLVESVTRLQKADAGGPHDRQQLARDAHSLVSAAGMLGFMELSGAYSELERACVEGSDVAGALDRVKWAGNQALAEISSLKNAA